MEKVNRTYLYILSGVKFLSLSLSSVRGRRIHSFYVVDVQRQILIFCAKERSLAIKL